MSPPIGRRAAQLSKTASRELLHRSKQKADWPGVCTSPGVAGLFVGRIRRRGMALKIEDYGLIGDTHTAGLVGRNGSIDWLCLPRFDSGACFAALLGNESHGRWLISPAATETSTRRRYRADTLILETDFETAGGIARVIDFMTPRRREPDVIRIGEGIRGEVPMQMELVIRFDYGSIVPWVRTIDGHLQAIGGPDAVSLWTDVHTYGQALTTRGDFVVHEGERVSFLLMWYQSHTAPPEPFDAVDALHETERWWRDWSGRCGYTGPWRDQVVRSLITLKALTYAPVYGEVMDALHLSRRVGIAPDPESWALQKALLRFLERAWCQPDDGIWEVRGPRRHFTHSKVMAWVAFDRAVKAVERHGLEGPVDRWRKLRANVHEEVCRQGFDADRNTFTQYYGSKELDASLLMIPLVGFLAADDPRVVGTVRAIERNLLRNGYVQRYQAKEHIDGLPAGEGVFLACTFWLADNYELQGRHEEARDLFERLLGLCNDLGLLAEEYDPDVGRQLGNFPQAFSHVMLINTARNLSRSHGPAEERQS
jgi:GH15 family glucan-1,4-alpha-glucosidase